MCIISVSVFTHMCVRYTFVGHDVCSTGVNICAHMPYLCQQKGVEAMAPSSNEHT